MLQTNQANIHTPPPSIANAPTARRTLIFDINNEYGEYDIKTIAFEHIPVFMRHPVAEIRRIAPFKQTPKGAAKMSTTDMLLMLENIVDMYQGGCLVIEDPSKFFSKSVSEDLIGAICTNRHNSCDMILHYQSVGRILPVLHENINLYRFHHQGDDVMRSKSKLEDQTEVFKLAQIMVDNNFFGRNGCKKTKYSFVYIDKDLGKIQGNFTMAHVDAAMEEYIRKRPSELKPWENERTDTGKKKYNYIQAKQAFKKHLFDLYFADTNSSDEEREAKMMAAIGFKGGGKTYETMRMLVEEICPSPLIYQKYFAKKAA